MQYDNHLYKNTDIIKSAEALKKCTDDLFIDPINAHIYLPVNSVATKPEYDEISEWKYNVTYRNAMGKKCPKELIIDLKNLVLKIGEIENAKETIVVQANQLAVAIPSENVNTQITILTRSDTTSREAYKFWVAENEIEKVEIIIKGVNRLIALSREHEESEKKK